MKNFYYKIEKSSKRYYGGRNETASIYTVKKGKIEKVGSCEWCTASYRGAKHEIFNALMQLKLIPKKYYESSKCEWRGGGYFAGEVCKKYTIEELQ